MLESELVSNSRQVRRIDKSELITEANTWNLTGTPTIWRCLSLQTLFQVFICWRMTVRSIWLKPLFSKSKASLSWEGGEEEEKSSTYYSKADIFFACTSFILIKFLRYFVAQNVSHVSLQTEQRWYLNDAKSTPRLPASFFFVWKKRGSSLFFQ